MCIIGAETAAAWGMSVGAANAAVIGGAISTPGMVTSAVGQYQQGQAQAKQAEYQAGIARNNAIMAQHEADYRAKTGVQERQQHQLKIEQLKGAQRAAIGASGVEMTSGSPLDLLMDTSEQGAADLLRIDQNTALDIWRIRGGQANYEAQAGLFDASAAGYRSGGAFGAGTTLLTGLGNNLWRMSSMRTG